MAFEKKIGIKEYLIAENFKILIKFNNFHYAYINNNEIDFKVESIKLLSSLYIIIFNFLLNFKLNNEKELLLYNNKVNTVIKFIIDDNNFLKIQKYNLFNKNEIELFNLYFLNNNNIDSLIINFHKLFVDVFKNI